LATELKVVSTIDVFFHVRMLVGIITGLSMYRVLSGLARPVQHGDWKTVGYVHTAWAIYLLLTIVHFWWFEFGLSRVDKWTFGLYLFVIGYGILLFFTCTILFPDHMDRYTDQEEYFFSRKAWFYGLLAAIFLVDVGDSAIKGQAHLQALGLEYLLRQIAMITLSLIAIFVRWRPYHAAFASAGILHQVWWALRQFDVF
jgi:hypothetical protein